MRSNSTLFIRTIAMQSDVIGFMSRDAARPNLGRGLMIELKLADGQVPQLPVRTLG